MMMTMRGARARSRYVILRESFRRHHRVRRREISQINMISHVYALSFVVQVPDWTFGIHVRARASVEVALD